MRTKLRLLSALSCSVGVTGVGEITARKQKRHGLPAAQVGLKALAMVAREPGKTQRRVGFKVMLLDAAPQILPILCQNGLVR